MMQLFSIIVFVFCIVFVNLLLAIFVVPNALSFFRALLKGELFLSVLDMFMTVFILGSVTFLLISLLLT